MNLPQELVRVAAVCRRYCTRLHPYVGEDWSDCPDDRSFVDTSVTVAWQTWVTEFAGDPERPETFPWEAQWHALVKAVSRALSQVLRNRSTNGGARRHPLVSLDLAPTPDDAPSPLDQLLAFESESTRAAQQLYTHELLHRLYSPTELALLYSVYVQGRSQHAIAEDYIQAGLYPDSDEGRRRARNAVHVAMHRIRKKGRQHDELRRMWKALAC